jgi:hypothetical protein
VFPFGGLISESFETPTSFPFPKRLGLSWDVYQKFLCRVKSIALLRVKVNRKYGQCLWTHVQKVEAWILILQLPVDDYRSKSFQIANSSKTTVQEVTSWLSKIVFVGLKYNRL